MSQIDPFQEYLKEFDRLFFDKAYNCEGGKYEGGQRFVKYKNEVFSCEDYLRFRGQEDGIIDLD